MITRVDRLHLSTLGLLGAGILGAAVVGPEAHAKADKVYVCHATGSASNPYVVVWVDRSAWDQNPSSKGHWHHEDDFEARAGEKGWTCEKEPPPPPGPRECGDLALYFNDTAVLVSEVDGSFDIHAYRVENADGYTLRWSDPGEEGGLAAGSATVRITPSDPADSSQITAFVKPVDDMGTFVVDLASTDDGALCKADGDIFICSGDEGSLTMAYNYYDVAVITDPVDGSAGCEAALTLYASS